MAYIGQDTKKLIEPVVNAILRKYGLKGSLSIKHDIDLTLTIHSGAIDFVESYNRIGPTERILFTFHPITNGYIQVNPYWYHKDCDGLAKSCLAELIAAMNLGNWNHSRPEIDYFSVGWYITINIGKWDKPYVCTKGNWWLPSFRRMR